MRRGCPPSHYMGKKSGKGVCPLLRKFMVSEAQNGEFWFILGAVVYSLAACFTRKKLVLLGLENLQQLYPVHSRQWHAEKQKAKYACWQL